MLFGKKENYEDKKSIIIYFSRADENYSVGYLDKGNTEVIAEYFESQGYSSQHTGGGQVTHEEDIMK